MIVKTVKMHVRIGGLTKDEPPMLAYSKIVTRPDGKRKLFSQMVQVTDGGLLARLRRDVQSGDEAEIVIEQRLGEGITSILLDFAPVRVPEPAAAAY